MFPRGLHACVLTRTISLSSRGITLSFRAVSLSFPAISPSYLLFHFPQTILIQQQFFPYFLNGKFTRFTIRNKNKSVLYKLELIILYAFPYKLNEHEHNAITETIITTI